MAPGKQAHNLKRPRSATRVPPVREPAPRRRPAKVSPGTRLLLAKGPAAATLLFSLWLLLVFLGGERFRVTAVTVEGAQLAPVAEVQALAQISGGSVFRVAAHRLEQRIRDEYGFVRDVQVRCRMPSDVTIVLQEHPVAFVWESGGQRWWVDREGLLWGNAPVEGGRITIRDVEGYAPEPEGHIVGVPWRLAVELLRALPEIPEFEYTRDEGLILYATEKAWPVYLGHEGDAANKAAVLRALAERLVAEGVEVEYLDLRNEQRPAYKLRP